MGWSFNKVTTKKGTKYRVHVSFRKEGKPTSTNCGYIDNIEQLKKEYGEKFDDFINKEGEKIYQKWLETLKTKHTFTLNESDENDDGYLVFSGQYYLKTIRNNLGLTKLINSYKELDKLKIQYNLSDLIFYLVSKQVLDPSSKFSSYKNQESFSLNPSIKNKEPFYNCLTTLAKHADEINLNTYKKALKYIGKSSKLYFYDVTTVNLSKSCPVNDLVGLKKGKEGIYGPIIQIGYLCDEWGLLIGLIVFNGSKNEQSTLKEQITKIYGTTKVKDVVICTDAGLCSIKNKRYCEKNFKGYITTQSLKINKVPADVSEWALNYKYKVGDEELTKNEIVAKYHKLLDDGNFEEAERLMNKSFFGNRWFKTIISVDYKQKEKLINMSGIKRKSNKETLQNFDEKQLSTIKKGSPLKITFEQRLVISFNLKYYFSQLYDIEKDVEKAKKAIEDKLDVKGSSKKDFKRFLSTSNITSQGEVVEEIPTTFLEDVYQDEVKYCGLYCQATNLSDDEHTIYNSSRERWVIENLFRTAKTDLEMSKVYLQDVDHIIGHFEICFLAQTLLRTFVYKIYNSLNHKDKQIGKIETSDNQKITQDEIIEELRSLKGFIKNDDNGVKCLISCSRKNDINKLFAETFKYSVTLQARPLENFKKI